jgi:hypothetical protein
LHGPATFLLLRFGPLDLLEDASAPLLLEQQQHSLAWSADAQALLQQRGSEQDFQRAAEAALQAAQAVRLHAGSWWQVWMLQAYQCPLSRFEA